MLAELLEVHGIVPLGLLADYAILLGIHFTLSGTIVRELLVSFVSVIGRQQKFLLLVQLLLQINDLLEQKSALTLHLLCLFLKRTFALCKHLVVFLQLRDVDFLLLKHFLLARLAHDFQWLCAEDRFVALPVPASDQLRVKVSEELVEACRHLAPRTGQPIAVQEDQLKLLEHFIFLLLLAGSSSVSSGVFDSL